LTIPIVPAATYPDGMCCAGLRRNPAGSPVRQGRL